MGNKVCRNKKCLKPLPESYKHKYCEACRNNQAQKVKNYTKTLGTVASVAIAVFTGIKIKSGE